MTNLFDYMQDGAHPSARAVLAILQGMGKIDDSWDSELKEYTATPKVARWENCREQGYIISLTADNYEQLNIAFFEHRNSDSICAIKWVQRSMNSITINTMKTDECYKDKYDVSHSVSYNEHYEMAEWIKLQFETFWKINQKPEKDII